MDTFAAVEDKVLVEKVGKKSMMFNSPHENTKIL